MAGGEAGGAPVCERSVGEAGRQKRGAAEWRAGLPGDPARCFGGKNALSAHPPEVLGVAWGQGCEEG